MTVEEQEKMKDEQEEQEVETKPSILKSKKIRSEKQLQTLAIGRLKRSEKCLERRQYKVQEEEIKKKEEMKKEILEELKKVEKQKLPELDTSPEVNTPQPPPITKPTFLLFKRKK
jgi:hypothetical protein